MAMTAGRDRWTRSESLLGGPRVSPDKRMGDGPAVGPASRPSGGIGAQAVRCQECPSVDLRRLEGLALECGPAI
jgi:hypothetical protein